MSKIYRDPNLTATPKTLYEAILAARDHAKGANLSEVATNVTIETYVRDFIAQKFGVAILQNEPAVGDILLKIFHEIVGK